MASFAGSFLVARHALQDSNFKRAVVLLIQHDGDGAFGVVVNRPVNVKDLPYQVFAGGPCESPGLLLLHGHAKWAKRSDADQHQEIAPGIFLGDATAVKKAEEKHSEKVDLRLRLFTGYAGWGPGQLEREIQAGAWALMPASAHLLFHTPAEELWDCLAPPRIPEPSIN